MTNQRCKGARDLLPQDTERFRLIEDSFRHSCLSWGYQEVKTPTLEYLHLFTAAGTLTPNMLSKVYSFLDWDGWSGERIVLRPDGTIPVARLYIENLAQEEIARLFYVTSVFIFEETGTENREKWQCGAELLGSAKPTADVELILLASEILRGLDISGIELKLSHAGLLKTLIKELKLDDEGKAKLLAEIQDGNWQILTQAKTGNSDISRLLSLLLDLRGQSSGFLENVKALPQISPELRAQLNSFAEVTAILDAIGYVYQIDITSTRGFEYYTGLCFQLLAKQDKIGSGGRYDNLVPLIGGRNTPACGFAIYIDPLMHIVKPEAKQKTEQKIIVRGKATKPDIVKASFQLAQSLREAGYIAELDFNGRKSDQRWLINVRDKSPTFIVTDQTKKVNEEAFLISDVINMIGGSP